MLSLPSMIPPGVTAHSERIVDYLAKWNGGGRIHALRPNRESGCFRQSPISEATPASKPPCLDRALKAKWIVSEWATIRELGTFSLRCPVREDRSGIIDVFLTEARGALEARPLGAESNRIVPLSTRMILAKGFGLSEVPAERA